MRRRIGALAAGATVLLMATFTPTLAAATSDGPVATAPSASDPGGQDSRAADTAAVWVATRPVSLHVGPDDGFVQLPVISSLGWRYVPYERTYRGLPVVGGDFVVVVDPADRVRSASVAQKYAVTRCRDHTTAEPGGHAAERGGPHAVSVEDGRWPARGVRAGVQQRGWRGSRRSSVSAPRARADSRSAWTPSPAQSWTAARTCCTTRDAPGTAEGASSPRH